MATGCATLNPRFDQAITASFARQPMRKLETGRVELYYPEAKRDEALRLIQRLDSCVEQLRRNRFSGTPRPKVLAYLTTANFDNAYVQPQVAGLPTQMVLAHHFTTEFFNLLEIGTNHVDDVSCHEAVHYVQFQEVDELWYYLNLAFGGNYLVGMHFIEWLARRYGADKLWELIDVQGRSWIPVLGVSFRFMWVYGKGPGELVDEWRESLRR